MGSFIRGLAIGVVATALILGGGAYLFRGVLPLILGAPTPEIPRDVVAAAAGSTKEMREQLLKELPFANNQDFEFAAQGFIGTRSDPLIKDASGKVVYDLSGYDFLNGDAPESVNPSLWRQARLVTRHGLFKVAERIYQVRGFDVSTVTFIVGDTGYIVVDPLVSTEVAKAALDLVREKLGDKPVVGVIYSHSHADHFGGAGGVIAAADAESGAVKVIAPPGFLEHAISENVIAGVAMGRRARYQFGITLPRGIEGEVTSGLGPALSRGSLSLIAPNVLVSKTGEEITVDGVTMQFQLTPGTEAPAEMNFYLPQFRAVFMAENANATMHNILTPRGALVRDAKAWADYLTESIRLWGDKSDIMFGAHGIPRFSMAAITDFLSKHRDAYKYLHDQSVRLMNGGLTGSEIAEVIRLPDVLAHEWYNRGYYGTMSHNSKAVYQRYMGWYDGNPASLNPLPPVAAAQKYIAAMGGADAVMAKAQEASNAGDYRWAAMLLNHVVFADGDNAAAREALAAVYTQMGYQAEAGTWRNIYLSGAQELRHGVAQLPPTTINADFLKAMPTTMLLDYAAVRLNPTRAAGKRIVLNIVLSDRNERHAITIENEVMIHEEGVTIAGADATVTMARPDFLQTLLAGVPVGLKTTTGAITSEGNGDAYGELAALIDPVDANFAIVTAE